MRISGIVSLIGWLLACLGVAASVVILWELQETRAALRLETVRLPTRPPEIPAQWNTEAHRVLLVGDSRIHRWSALPDMDGIVFARSGVGGETSGQLLDRFQRDVLALDPRPDEIILAVGINDLVAASVQTKWVEAVHGAVSDLVIAQLEEMVRLADDNGIKARVATIVQPASPDIVRRVLFWDDSLYALVDATNGRISSLGVPLIDFNAALDGGSGPLPARFSLDTLHFNSAAYEVLNDTLIAEFGSK